LQQKIANLDEVKDALLKNGASFELATRFGRLEMV
jgi:hypothetical protein